PAWRKRWGAVRPGVGGAAPREGTAHPFAGTNRPAGLRSPERVATRDGRGYDAPVSQSGPGGRWHATPGPDTGGTGSHADSGSYARTGSSQGGGVRRAGTPATPELAEGA